MLPFKFNLRRIIDKVATNLEKCIKALGTENNHSIGRDQIGRLFSYFIRVVLTYLLKKRIKMERGI